MIFILQTFFYWKNCSNFAAQIYYFQNETYYSIATFDFYCACCGVFTFFRA